MLDSGRALTKEYFLEFLLPVSLSLRWATATLHLCRIPTNTSRWIWFSLLWGHYSFPLGPDAHTTLCVSSRSGVSVSPSPVEVLQSNPASLQSLILWKFLLPLPDPQVGKPDVGLRTFSPVSGPLWYNCSPVCESPTQQLWDLILLWLRPSNHLIAASPLSLVVGYLFWWVPVSSCRWLSNSSGFLSFLRLNNIPLYI